MYNLSDVKIGLEFEPQFTCLQYAKTEIWFAKLGKDRWRATGYESRGMEVQVPNQFLSSKLFVDCSNIEIITDPVYLNELDLELTNSYKVLQEFVKNFSEFIGPVGCFLPRSKVDKSGIRTVSKHVNLSMNGVFVKEDPQRKILYDNTYKPTSTNDGIRIHLRVPYNFTNYLELGKIFVDHFNKSDVLETVFTGGKLEYSDKELKYHHNFLEDMANCVSKFYTKNKMKKPQFLCYSRNGSSIVTLSNLA